MTATYPKDAKFLGFGMTKARNFLIARNARRDLANVVSNKALDLDFREVALLSDEADLQGLLSMQEWHDCGRRYGSRQEVG